MGRCWRRPEHTWEPLDWDSTMDSDDEVIDPVCGMTITKAKAPFNVSYSGSVYYFCSTRCESSFKADADAYAAAAKLGLPGWGQTPHPESVVKQFRQS